MLKILVKEIREYKIPTIVTPILSFLEVLFETIIPLLMASIVDQGVVKGDTSHIYRLGAFMLLIALLSLGSGYLSGRLAAFASAGYAKNIRLALYQKIQQFSFANLDKFSTASLVTRLTTDVSNLQMAYQMMMRMFVRAPSNLIVAMVMAFIISPTLASVYLGVILFLGLTLAFIISRASKHFQEVFKKYDDLNRTVQENVLAMRVVKAYVREDYETNRFTHAAVEIYRLFTNAERIAAWIQPSMTASVNISILFISWLGAHMIVVGNLSTGNLMSLLTYCMQIMFSLMMLGMVFVMLTISSASIKRIVEVLEEEPTIQDPKNPITEVEEGSICFEHVSFHYGQHHEKEVLQDIQLNIPAGSSLGIIGATGSGKTSLVSLISRFYDTSAGLLKVGGRDVRTYSLECLRHNVAMVLQKNELFSGSIYDNIRWGNENATEEECRQVAKIAQADEFISRFPEGYHTLISQGGNNVSGGQKQRLCIARALLKKPKILILDDSTSALDTTTDAALRKALQEELPQMTKIIIAQRVSSVCDADQILVLEEGRIHGLGSHRELLEKDTLYRSIYEAQMSGNGDFDEGGDE